MMTRQLQPIERGRRAFRVGGRSAQGLDGQRLWGCGAEGRKREHSGGSASWCRSCARAFAMHLILGPPVQVLGLSCHGLHAGGGPRLQRVSLGGGASVRPCALGR